MEPHGFNWTTNMKKLFIAFLIFISTSCFGALPKTWAPGEDVKGFPDLNNNFGYMESLLDDIYNEIASSSFGTLGSLVDTDIVSASDGEVLTYQASTTKWINLPSSGGGGSVDTATITTAIDANAASITLNIASITALQADAADAWDSINANSASITINISDIAANAASISLNIASITALEAGGGSEWTASGSTQIYTEKSVGIGTSTPEVDNVIDVYSKDGTKHLYMNNTKFRVEDPTYSYTYFELNYAGQFWAYRGFAGYSFTAPQYQFLSSFGYKGAIGFDSNTNMNFRCPDNSQVSHIVLKLMGDTQDVLIGSTVDDGVNKLQVTGDSKFENIAASGTINLNGYSAIKWANSADPTNTYYWNALKQTGGGYLSIYSRDAKILSINPGNVRVDGVLTCYQPIQLYTQSAAAPGYSFNSDTNCGMFYTGTADTFGFSTGGVEAARFTDNQNLLLGSTVDDGINKLQVTGDSKFNGNIYGENTFELYAGGALKLQMVGTFNTYCKGNWVFNSTPQLNDGFKMYTDDDTSVGHPLANTIDFTTGGVEAARFTASHTLNLSNTPVYADNTAALAGGLVAGDVYRTSTGVLMITY